MICLSDKIYITNISGMCNIFDFKNIYKPCFFFYTIIFKSNQELLLLLIRYEIYKKIFINKIIIIDTIF